jgi:putative hydroxymethylpyrimidine transport system ATP-binding protein
MAFGLHFEGSAWIGSDRIFSDVSFAVPTGKWTCLLGPSGVGKSTILRLFAGLDFGVSFQGDIKADDARPLDGRVALMAQSDMLLPWLSAEENVLIGAKVRGDRPDHDRARDVLERVELSAHIHKRPGEMSGGQRQRVALARTLIEDRSVILLDEPFGALDARTRASMQELARNLLHGKTVLLVTHDPAEAARLGEHILVLTEDGIKQVSPPTAPIPRHFEDPETLATQGRLLSLLRGET